MGKNYEAAVFASATCGFGMGATPNAIANMDELTNRYGYPKELIDVEVNINMETKAERVDVVVYAYENKDKVPFIFIKTNKLGVGAERDILHIKEYMSNYDTVRYGIVTDGDEIVIINNDLEEIDDIPCFRSVL